MIEVVVVGEGQTEETFVRDVVAPALWSRNVSMQPRLIRTSSSGHGGALAPDRVVGFLRKTLRERDDTYVTTLFDLYALHGEFPGVRECAAIVDPIHRAAGIEARLAEVVVRAAQRRADRFLPHIQPYEFEALLFSDIARLAEHQPGWRGSLSALHVARTAAVSPEHINDGPATHPSALLKSLLTPRYNKVLHGPAIAARIGLDRIRKECTHFAAWLERLEGLPAL